MSKTRLHILLVEDDPLDAELNKEQLLQLKEFECEFNWVSTKEAYLNALSNTTPDLILCDYNLPQYNGSQALKDLRERNKLIPFIFVTGTMNEETAADAIKAGAWDYVVKDRLFRLPLAVRGVLNLREERKIASESEQKILRLVTAIDQSTAQIIVMENDGTVEYVNQRFTEVTGYYPDEVVGKNALVKSPQNISLGIADSDIEELKKGKIFRGEVQSISKNGNQIWEIVSITPIFSENNRISNYVAVKEDITGRKKMELELVEARDKAEQSDKLKDAFLQNMSHEIRTPLNAIVGFSNLLFEGNSLDFETIRNYTSIICNSSNQLLNIVNDVLTISSIQTGQEITMFTPVNLNQICRHVYEILLPVAQAKQIDLKWYINDNREINLVSDATKLTQIITNLINNAIKFTSVGEVAIAFDVRDTQIELRISDTGIGIPKEQCHLIFERFYQVQSDSKAAQRGTGLGLSISQSFAHMLGGSIRVESEQGKGSVFYFTFPYQPA